MNPKRRVRICHVIENLRKDPEMAKRLGVTDASHFVKGKPSGSENYSQNSLSGYSLV